MTPKQLKKTLIKTTAAGLPALIKGAPGVGKSDIVAQVAKELGMNLIITHPVVSDPTDFKGLPGIVEGQAEFLPYGDLRKLLEADKPTICFLDDLGQAPAAVQAAAMQLILARRVNGHVVSDKVVFLAATNRREDRAGVTGILEPVKSRFATILALEPSVDEWVEWALSNDMPTELIAWVRFRPNLLWAPNPTADIVNSPCPRTIAFAGKLINAGITDMETLAGSIGEGAAAELVGFLRICNELPDIDEILLNPTQAPVPQNPAALYAVASALSRKASMDNAKAFFTYVDRLPKEFAVFSIRDAVAQTKTLCNTRPYIEWTAKNQNILT